MGAMASQITSLTIVYSTAYSDADQRKHQSSASLAFVQGIHRWPVNSPQKWPVTRKKFPFHDVIIFVYFWRWFHSRCWTSVYSPDCANDRLAYVDDLAVTIHCGYHITQLPSSSSNMASLLFYSEYSYSRRGFEIFYEAVNSSNLETDTRIEVMGKYLGWNLYVKVVKPSKITISNTMWMVSHWKQIKGNLSMFCLLDNLNLRMIKLLPYTSISMA